MADTPKIPKILHYVWLGGKPLPARYAEYIEGWKRLMPDYTVMEWNESNFDFSRSRYASQAYERKKFGFVPDYIRVAVLEQYGGIYLDADVEVLKPFDELLSDDMFVCFENDCNVETAVLGSMPHHPYFKKMKQVYEALSFVKNNGELNLMPSPFYFTCILYGDYGLKLKPVAQTLSGKDGESIGVYTADYFAPIEFVTNELRVSDNTYCVHRFSNSWSGKKQLREQNFIRGVRKLFGKKIFASFTRAYSKSCYRKIMRQLKKSSQTP